MALLVLRMAEKDKGDATLFPIHFLRLTILLHFMPAAFHGVLALTWPLLHASFGGWQQVIRA